MKNILNTLNNLLDKADKMNGRFNTDDDLSPNRDVTSEVNNTSTMKAI